MYTIHLRNVRTVALLVFVCLVSRIGHGEEALLVLEKGRAEGLVGTSVDLTAAATICSATPVDPGGIRAMDSDGQAIPFQFIPGAEFDPQQNVAGTALLKLPASYRPPLRLKFESSRPDSTTWDGKITTAAYDIEHDATRNGGFPARITFSSGKEFETMRWNNRVHHRELGSFCLCDDSDARVERVSIGPLCTVVRVRAHFVQGGRRPASEPWAVYDWCYFHNEPIAFVTATFGQSEPFLWHELHFLEMDYPRDAFPFWAGGEPLSKGEFKETKDTHSCSHWGAVYDGLNAIGMFQCGQALFYDAGPATYLQAHGDSAWRPWQNTREQFSAWLWIGTDDDPVDAIRAASQRNLLDTRAIATVDTVRTHIQAASKQFEAAPPPVRMAGMWQLEGARQLENQGRLTEAISVADGKKPENWTVLTAGALTMILENTSGGIHLLNLFDAKTRQRLTTTTPEPLFSMTLREASGTDEIAIAADTGWGETQVVPGGSDGSVELHWKVPDNKRIGDLVVTARAVPDQDGDSIRWELSAGGQSAPWSLWRVAFPQVAVPDLGPNSAVYFPKGCGEVQTGVWNQPFRFEGTYPSGWTTMQFMAAYCEDRDTGLYVAVHDPWGGTKQMQCSSRPANGDVLLRYEHPVPDMGRPGNRFELCGTGVWKLLRGDWFDAALTYRAWVRSQAEWYPKLTSDGRADTPQWMRELSAWALTGGPPEECVSAVKDFARFLGPPVGFHWYNWHQIPFDNDYPHYFPTRPGVPQGVEELQSSGVHVMPYINGRLWDTRDKGAEDYQFRSVALPAVSKNEQGEPYTESYSSKESDGSTVRLGVMCPATELWQAKVREIVLRIMNECGTRGVYIDQVAAAKPTLCFDETHGHPLGGGHWWNQGYWKMLDQIRQEMPADRMLTTECNGEPYIRCFDGYLTWHWQYDGQVPAFPAVYGGSVQMFGRSFGGGDTKDLAFRMKVAQQLVFGEQIGWISPGLAKEEANADFFKQAVQLRRRLCRYFYAGEMARPPKLIGDIPTVRADWQWHGETWVTTNAVLTGAWHLPRENRLLLILVNVSDEPQTGRLDYDTKEYGFASPSRIQREVAIPPRSMSSIEITPD